ncbi:hypothetical protein ACFFTK_13755 [Pseudonocardia petroleophila]
MRLQEAQPCEEGARRARPVDGCDREDRSTPNPADQLRRASSPDHGVGGGPADQDVDSAPNEDPTVRAAQRDGDRRRPHATADPGHGGAVGSVDATWQMVGHRIPWIGMS